MSNSPITSKSFKMSATRHRGKLFNEDNNNRRNKSLERQQARTFITWYKQMLDNERHNFALYLSDDASLEWFGRTIKTRKKVTAFLKHDMQCSRHDFTTVESIEKIECRQDRLQRTEDSILASPLNSPELLKPKNERLSRKRGLRSNCDSPEWADGCQPQDEILSLERKRLKTSHTDSIQVGSNNAEPIKHGFREDSSEITNNGDSSLSIRSKRNVSVTPPNKEIGQGDCLPSTSGTDSDRSHDALNAQLQKLAVECNGYIDFTRTRNNRNVDSMKWARKCKVQISYSEDPLNVGEYIIWALRYTDESKCRRNLMAAFNEVANEDEVKKI